MCPVERKAIPPNVGSTTGVPAKSSLLEYKYNGAKPKEDCFLHKLPFKWYNLLTKHKIDI